MGENGICLHFQSFVAIKVLALSMEKPTPKPNYGALHFSTRSHPTFGRQRKPFDEQNPPKTVTDSPYYWWYMFLKLNDGYRQTCADNGQGECTALYADFGNVHTTNFKDWWKEKVSFFAEPSQGYKMAIAKNISEIAPFDSDEVLNLVVPLNRSQRSLKKTFTALVLSKLEKGKRGVSVEDSQAKYRLSGKWNIEALATAYKIYKLRQGSLASGKKVYWADIAVEAKLPMSHALKGATKQAKSDVRRTLTILAKRHYDRAEQYIKSTVGGVFPYAK